MLRRFGFAVSKQLVHLVSYNQKSKFLTQGNQLLPSGIRKSYSSGVVESRNGVYEFGPESRRSRFELLLQIIYIKTVLISRNGIGVEIEVLEGVDGKEVAGILRIDNISRKQLA